MNKFFFKPLLIISFFFNSFLFAQNEVQINFDSYYDFDFPKKIPSQLILRENESLFVEYISKSVDWKKGEDAEIANGIKVSDLESFYTSEIVNESMFYKKNANAAVFFNDFFEGKDVWIEDDIKKIDWEISKNKRKIADFNCFLATCDFRGNKWLVWFTYDLPISSGPWKLSGLPGVILEAKTVNDKIQYIATKITYKNNENSIKPNFEKEVIFFKDFIMNRYSDFDLDILPRGENQTKIYFNDPLEPKYEWEE